MEADRGATAAAKRQSSPQWRETRREATGRFTPVGGGAAWPIVFLGALLLMGCASLGGGRSDERSADDGVSMNDGAIILRGSALMGGSGNLLAAMTGKVPNFRVVRNVARQCPQIALRNRRINVQGYWVNPHVYVDGTRATDTCILESLGSDDVERIEVYPQGFTKRPGYGSHAQGLILVFMRSG